MFADNRAARADARRRSAILIKTTLHAVERDLDSIDGPAAISLVTVLSRESWSTSGAPFPEYLRSAIPIRFIAGRRT